MNDEEMDDMADSCVYSDDTAPAWTRRAVLKALRTVRDRTRADTLAEVRAAVEDKRSHGPPDPDDYHVGIDDAIDAIDRLAQRKDGA